MWMELRKYSNWHLPKLEELTSIVEGNKSDPSIDSGKFFNTKSSPYWTSTLAVLKNNYAYYVEFNQGNIFSIPKNWNEVYVRCVRRGK